MQGGFSNHWKLPRHKFPIPGISDFGFSPAFDTLRAMSGASAIFLSHMTVADFEALLKSWGEPAFRGRQIYRQVFVNLAESVQTMTDLPARLRERLAAETKFFSLELAKVQIGDGGLTRKALFKLPDGSPVETVLMVYEDRATVCVSSQSGCPMACVFCATGKLGFLHDLTAGQIVEQVLWAAHELKKIRAERSPHETAAMPERVGNIVFMGMGEPFNNFDRWWESVNRLHDPNGMNFGARSLTVSTVGLVPGILRLARTKLPVNLAISLHAPDDALRSEMMPVNIRFPIADLIAATRTYTETTHRRVSFEYVLLKEKNDSPAQALALAKLLHGETHQRTLLCHVNLIPWNPVPGTPLGRSDRRRVLDFQQVLTDYKISCTVRVERGVKIGAACGQLAGGGEIPKIDEVEDFEVAS
jgi:23S rRNA (adenine2503-C2)-methyltransferase